MANKYHRKETYPPSAVLDFLPDLSALPRNIKLKKIVRDYDGDKIKMGSDRYYTFAKSLKCAHCDLVGSFFAKERCIYQDSESYHFNLYALDTDGNEVLMTKDHIIPKSLNGRNHISNYTTMCTVCNGIKQNTPESEAIINAQQRNS